MVEILAKQSIEIKLKLKSKIILSNYEFYYLCGRISNMAGIEFQKLENPLGMKEQIKDIHISEDNEIWNQLIEMANLYEVEEKWDVQMMNLYNMGKSDM